MSTCNRRKLKIHLCVENKRVYRKFISRNIHFYKFVAEEFILFISLPKTFKCSLDQFCYSERIYFWCYRFMIGVSNWFYLLVELKKIVFFFLTDFTVKATFPAWHSFSKPKFCVTTSDTCKYADDYIYISIYVIS